MKLNTLSYAYSYQAPKEKMFSTLLEQQLKYFNYFDKNITELHEGQEIEVEMKTGNGKATVPTFIKIVKMVPEKLFEIRTRRNNENDIIQTFEFVTDEKDGKEKLICRQSSQSGDEKSPNYFFLGVFIYKMLYKWSMKKKLVQLDKLAS